MIKKFIIIYFLLVSMVLSDECYYENKTTSKSVSEQTPKSTSNSSLINNIRSYVLKKLTPDNKKLILLITFGLVTIVILYTENSNHIIQKG